jgi:hypothetical protein
MNRASWLLAVAGAALCAACSSPDQQVIESYFNAVRSKDEQTLSSFATVKFDKPVQSWKILAATAEERAPHSLPDLIKKAKAAEDAVAQNKRTAQFYVNEHFAEVDQVKELMKKSAAIPPKLREVAARWEEFNAKDRDLKKASAEARDAMEKERRMAGLSVGQLDDLDALTGDVASKQVDLEITPGGETYVMSLRRYDLKREGAGARIISRWVVTGLHRKG